MTEDPGGAVKRRFERFDVRDCRAEVHKSGFLGFGKKEDIGGPILDMSDSGMRFNSAEKATLGVALKATLKLGPIGATFDVKAVVRWSHTAPDGRFIVGVEFDGISDADKDTLRKLREKLMTRPA